MGTHRNSLRLHSDLVRLGIDEETMRKLLQPDRGGFQQYLGAKEVLQKLDASHAWPGERTTEVQDGPL